MCILLCKLCHLLFLKASVSGADCWVSSWILAPSCIDPQWVHSSLSGFSLPFFWQPTSLSTQLSFSSISLVGELR